MTNGEVSQLELYLKTKEQELPHFFYSNVLHCHINGKSKVELAETENTGLNITDCNEQKYNAESWLDMLAIYEMKSSMVLMELT